MPACCCCPNEDDVENNDPAAGLERAYADNAQQQSQKGKALTNSTNNQQPQNQDEQHYDDANDEQQQLQEIGEENDNEMHDDGADDDGEPPPIDPTTIWSKFGSDGVVNDPNEIEITPNENYKFDLPTGWGGKPSGGNNEEEINDENRAPSGGPRSAPNTNAHADYIGGTRKDQEISEGVMDRIKGLEDQGLQTKKRMGRKMLTPRIVTDVKETWDNDGNLKREMKHYIEHVDGTKRVEKEIQFIPAGSNGEPQDITNTASAHLNGMNQPQYDDDNSNGSNASLNEDELFNPPREPVSKPLLAAARRASKTKALIESMPKTIPE